MYKTKRNVIDRIMIHEIYWYCY